MLKTKEIKMTYTGYSNLNEQEKKLFWNLPADKLKVIYQSKEKALSETTFRFGQKSGHNNSVDAFRHCYWSALLARDVGYELALEITTTHEDFSQNPLDEKVMDLHNNAVGLKIGVGQYKTDPVIAEECKNVLLRGQLKTLRF
jgi:hypothetical protein